jgi:hypothetical protein
MPDGKVSSRVQLYRDEAHSQTKSALITQGAQGLDESFKTRFK